jgi:hypothetical protein
LEVLLRMKQPSAVPILICAAYVRNLLLAEIVRPGSPANRQLSPQNPPGVQLLADLLKLARLGLPPLARASLHTTLPVFRYPPSGPVPARNAAASLPSTPTKSIRVTLTLMWPQPTA